MHNLPIPKRSEENLERIALAMGKIKRIDREDIDCPFKRNFVWVRVELDISKPLMRGFALKREGLPSIWIHFMYERVNGVCCSCGIVGHEKEKMNQIGEEHMKITENKLLRWVTVVSR